MHITTAKLLDVIALLTDKADENSVFGQVGTIIEGLAPDLFGVPFSGFEGRTLLLPNYDAKSFSCFTMDRYSRRKYYPAKPTQGQTHVLKKAHADAPH